MLKLENIQKSYSHFTLQCSLELLPGRITGLVGQNGSGKTTIFKIALGLVIPDSGTVALLGKNSCDLNSSDKENAGVVFADSGFHTIFTIQTLTGVLRRLYTLFDEVWFLQQAERFNLPLQKKISTFSTGMKTRLKFLIALSHQPKVLILDEPTLGLDVIVRNELLDMLREYMEQDESRSILISSHIAGDLDQLCDDIYMLHNGRIILHEDTDILLDRYGILKVPSGSDITPDSSHILRRMKESYGYSYLTDQLPFYAENYPSLVHEKCSIDSIITHMIKGEKP